MTLGFGAILLIGGILLIYPVVEIVLVIWALFRLTAPRPSEDRPVASPILRFGRVGGKDGRTRYSGLFVISAYADGLWVTAGSRDRGIFVPWENIAVSRTSTILGQCAELDIGSPVTLIVPSYVADALADVAMNRWPESGPIRKVTWRDVALSLLWLWAVISMFGAAFFCAGLALVSWIDGHGHSFLFPLLFPSIPFGLICIVMFFIDCHALSSGAARADSQP